MLYLIGLGLNEISLPLEALEAIKKCKKIYLDSYTTEIPYHLKKLEKIIDKKIISLKREDIESEKLVKESKNENICLLVYGSPFFATTHISLIEDCKKEKIKVKIIYNASIFDAIGETGLQLYKFGKITSMPKFQENFKPTSFLDIVKENLKINSHSLILVDLGLDFETALAQLVEASKVKKVKINKILVCSQLDFNSKIYYFHINQITKLKNLKNKIKTPFCFIVPGKMHFVEKEVLERFEMKK